MHLDFPHFLPLDGERVEGEGAVRAVGEPIAENDCPCLDLAQPGEVDIEGIFVMRLDVPALQLDQLFLDFFQILASLPVVLG